MSDQKKCGRCGNTLDPKFTFCPFCGQSLETAAPGETPAPPNVSTPAAGTLDTFEKQFEALKKQRAAAKPRRQWDISGWYYVVLIGITVVALAGFFLYFRHIMQQLTAQQ